MLGELESQLADRFATVIAHDPSEDGHSWAYDLWGVTAQVATAAGPQHPEFTEVELETRIWSLVDGLQQASTDKERNSAVLKWLQSTIPRPDKPQGLLSSKWMATRQLASKPGSGKLAELDADAPLRLGLPLEESDAVADDTLYKYVFELLETGDWEGASAACASTQNWLLKSIVEMGAHNKSPLLVNTLRQACQIDELPHGERAVFGFLCGDVATVLSMDQSWEAQLLASLVESRRPLRDVAARLPGDNPHRLVVKALLSDNLADFSENVCDKATQGSFNDADAWLLRLAVHLQLACHQKVPAHVLHVYLQMLFLCDKTSLVPVYLTFLSPDDLRDVYGKLITQIADEGQRADQLARCRVRGIDPRPAVRVAMRIVQKERPVDIVSPKKRPEVTSQSAESDPDSWICHLGALFSWYRDLGMWEELQPLLLTSLTTALEAGRPREFFFLSCQIPISQFVEQYEIPELAELAKLASALDAINTWDRYFQSGTRGSRPHHDLSRVQTAIRAACKAQLSEHIRTMYVPYLIFEELRVLQEALTEQRFAQQAFNLATFVADDRNNVFHLFSADDRRTLLLRIAEAEMIGLDYMRFR